MLTDGSLMRLAKDDFNTLLKEPMLDWIEFDAANELVAAGTARWLDVRLPSEFDASTCRGAINVPLYLAASQARAARSQSAVRRRLRYRSAQLSRRVHPQGAWFRRVRAEGRTDGGGDRAPVLTGATRYSSAGSG